MKKIAAYQRKTDILGNVSIDPDVYEKWLTETPKHIREQQESLEIELIKSCQSDKSSFENLCDKLNELESYPLTAYFGLTLLEKIVKSSSSCDSLKFLQYLLEEKDYGDLIIFKCNWLELMKMTNNISFFQYLFNRYCNLFEIEDLCGSLLGCWSTITLPIELFIESKCIRDFIKAYLEYQIELVKRVGNIPSEINLMQYIFSSDCMHR